MFYADKPGLTRENPSFTKTIIILRENPGLSRVILSFVENPSLSKKHIV